MPRALLTSACLALCLASPKKAGAEADTPPDPNAFVTEPAVLPASLAAASVRRLSLTEAVRLAVSSNLGIVLSRQALEQGQHAVVSREARFEPTLNALFEHRDSAVPPSSLLDGRAEQILSSRLDTLNFGYRQELGLGTTLELDFDNARSQSNFGSAIGPLYYTSAVNLRLTQPLLRGFAFDLDVPRAEILRAEFASAGARQAVVEAIITTIRDTELGYWDLVQALKSHEVQAQGLALAEQQVELTQRQIDAGIRPPSDLINALGTLAQRELFLLRSEAAISTVADQLRHLLNLPLAAWSDALLPVDVPRFEDVPISLDAAYARALTHRPELERQKLAISRAALDVRVAATERWPKLDLSLGYGLIGQTPSYADTLRQLSSGDTRVYSALLNLTWTPLNRAAGATLDRARVAERSERTLLEQALLDLQLELRAALRALDTAARSVQAAAKLRVLAERSLDAEQRKFQNGDGTSSSFFIAQRQNDLSQARLEELSALILHQKARTSLHAAMGVLLEERGVRLDVRLDVRSAAERRSP